MLITKKRRKNPSSNLVAGVAKLLSKITCNFLKT
jgi:hypothetical protein